MSGKAPNLFYNAFVNALYLEFQHIYQVWPSIMLILVQIELRLYCTHKYSTRKVDFIVQLTNSAGETRSRGWDMASPDSVWPTPYLTNVQMTDEIKSLGINN